MDSSTDQRAELAALAWQVELGADEAIGDAPVNRFRQPEPEVKKPAEEPVARHAASSVTGPDPVEIARKAAGAANDLASLAEAIGAFDLCELKRGALNTVFADGNPDARVMVIGEAPGREEDKLGRPFVGRAGQLLDRMFAAIGLSRTAQETDRALYITNILPWRPPQNRDPKPDEMAMMVPFVERHVELADPEVLVLMGNISCQALLGRRGITRLRGHWAQALGKPALPMFHPAYLLRNPHAKREAWHDLLMLNTWLKENH